MELAYFVSHFCYGACAFQFAFLNVNNDETWREFSVALNLTAVMLFLALCLYLFVMHSNIYNYTFLLSSCVEDPSGHAIVNFVSGLHRNTEFSKNTTIEFNDRSSIGN